MMLFNVVDPKPVGMVDLRQVSSNDTMNTQELSLGVQIPWPAESLFHYITLHISLLTAESGPMQVYSHLLEGKKEVVLSMKWDIR